MGDGAIWEATHRCTDATQRLSVLRQLVEVHHADINIEMGLVLHWACYNGHADMVGYISMQWDIRIIYATSEKQLSPLHVACQKGSVDVVRQLLSQSDIQVSLADQDGWTPIRYACQMGCVDVVRQLLSCAGIQVNPADQDGPTPSFGLVKWASLLWRIIFGRPS